MWQALKESKLLSFLSLFTSFGTLLCCALPSTLVLMGFGAGLAGFLGEYPELIWLSENKGIVFSLSFFMLALSYAGIRYGEAKACPIDKAQDCQTTKSWAKPLFFVTLAINLVGVFYAFLLPRLL